MNPCEYFKLIQDSQYITDGKDVDWNIIIDEKEKVIRLLFQETTSKTDWITNFMFFIHFYKKQENHFFVCKGWGKAWKSCNDIIMSKMKEKIQLYPSYKVEILGWSYGGAMAQLAAEDLHYRELIKPDLITFGSPKPLVGKKTQKYFRSCCNEVHQYSNINDCVCYLPPFIGYKRISTDKIGSNFCIIKLFKPSKYHYSYGDKNLYI